MPADTMKPQSPTAKGLDAAGFAFVTLGNVLSGVSDLVDDRYHECAYGEDADGRCLMPSPMDFMSRFASLRSM
jgi:hypothetical protein